MDVRASLQRLVLLGTTVMLTACGSTGGRVTTLDEPGFSATAGQSWAWQPVASPPPAATLADNDIVRASLERGVAAALASRGLRMAAGAAEADYLLAIRVGVQKRTEVRETPVDPFPRQRIVCGPRGCIPVVETWGWYGPPPTMSRTIEYLEGGVMLDVTDRRTNRLVWRGTITDRVDGQLPPQATIDAAMAKLIEPLPIAP